MKKALLIVALLISASTLVTLTGCQQTPGKTTVIQVPVAVPAAQQPNGVKLDVNYHTTIK